MDDVDDAKVSILALSKSTKKESEVRLLCLFRAIADVPWISNSNFQPDRKGKKKASDEVRFSSVLMHTSNTW